MPKINVSSPETISKKLHQLILDSGMSLMLGDHNNVVFDYQYRDSDNYKQTRRVVMAGKPSPEDLQTILSSLRDGMYFIPGKVGLDDLQTEWNDEVDHPFHYILSIVGTDEDPTPGAPLVRQLVEKFSEIGQGANWDDGYIPSSVSPAP